MTHIVGAVLAGTGAGILIVAVSGYLLLMYGPDLPPGAW